MKGGGGASTGAKSKYWLSSTRSYYIIIADLCVLLPRHSPQPDKPHSDCHSAVPAARLRVRGEEGHEPLHEGKRALRGLGQQQRREDLRGVKQRNMAEWISGVDTSFF